MSLPVHVDLALLAAEADLKDAENDAFRAFLKQADPVAIDNMVGALDRAITPQIDCTACGNCCKSLMVNVTDSDAERAAAHLRMSVPAFKQQYIEESQQGQMVIHTVPCLFLDDTRCSIYEGRFTECRNFPMLDQPGFTGRLFATFMHYGRCPIIYNVVEQLKSETGFIG